MARLDLYRRTIERRAEQLFSGAGFYPREPLIPVVQAMGKKSESQFLTELMGWKNIC